MITQARFSGRPARAVAKIIARGDGTRPPGSRQAD